ERAAAGRQELGESEDLGFGIVPPQHALRLAPASDADLHPVGLFQISGEGSRELPLIQPRLALKLLRPLLQLAKMVVVLLLEVVHLLGTNLRAVDAAPAF